MSPAPVAARMEEPPPRIAGKGWPVAQVILEEEVGSVDVVVVLRVYVAVWQHLLVGNDTPVSRGCIRIGTVGFLNTSSRRGIIACSCKCNG